MKLLHYGKNGFQSHILQCFVKKFQSTECFGDNTLTKIYLSTNSMFYEKPVFIRVIPVTAEELPITWILRGKGSRNWEWEEKTKTTLTMTAEVVL